MEILKIFSYIAFQIIYIAIIWRNHMKKIITLFIVLVFTGITFAQAPVIDGVFDGEAVWGTPASVADGIGGWPADGSFDPVNIDKIYVTYDNDYLYFCALFYADGLPQSFFKAAFIINSRDGGATFGPWGGAINFAHSNPPDFVLIARLGPQGDGSHWAESLEATDDGYAGYGTNVAGTDMEWGDDLTCIEARISKTQMGDPNITSIDFQFYVSNSDDDGVFDACPDDEVTTGWDTPTTLDNYEANYTVPVELTQFSANVVNNQVNLSWTTATETNNKGFEIQRTMNNEQLTMDSWESIGFVEGTGTTTENQSYSAVDKNITNGKYFYRLKQIDFDGSFSFSKQIEVEVGNVTNEFTLAQNYPNPFNPSTTINFGTKESIQTELAIFNELGEKIATLFNGTTEAGKLYSIEFNASDLPSGIYFYTLQGNNFRSVRKMLLLK